MRKYLDLAVPKIIVPVADVKPDPKNELFHQEMVRLGVEGWPSLVIWKPGSGWRPFDHLIENGEQKRQMSPSEFVAALEKTFPAPGGAAPTYESESCGRHRSFLRAVGGTNDQLDALKGGKLREESASQLLVWSSKTPFPGGGETTVQYSGLARAWWIESSLPEAFAAVSAELSACAALWSSDTESSGQGSIAAPGRSYTHELGDIPITVLLEKRGSSTAIRISR